MAHLRCSRATFALLVLFSVALAAEPLVQAGSTQEKDKSAKASYFVDGMVVHPGEYPIDEPVTAAQALKRAGGVLSSSNGRIYIVCGANHRKLNFSAPSDPRLERFSIAADDHIVVP